MVNAGALERHACVAVDGGGVADEHGVDQRRARRVPERVHVRENAAVGAARPIAPARTAEAGEQFDAVRPHRRQCGDAASRQIPAVIPRAGITEIARLPQPGRKAQPLAIIELAVSRSLGCIVVFALLARIDGQAHPGMNGGWWHTRLWHTRPRVCVFRGNDFLGLDLHDLPPVASEDANHAVVNHVRGDGHFRTVEVRRDLLAANGSGKFGIACFAGKTTKRRDCAKRRAHGGYRVLPAEHQCGGNQDQAGNRPPHRRTP